MVALQANKTEMPDRVCQQSNSYKNLLPRTIFTEILKSRRATGTE